MSTSILYLVIIILASSLFCAGVIAWHFFKKYDLERINSITLNAVFIENREQIKYLEAKIKILREGLNGQQVVTSPDLLKNTYDSLSEIEHKLRATRRNEPIRNMVIKVIETIQDVMYKK